MRIIGKVHSKDAHTHTLIHTLAHTQKLQQTCINFAPKSRLGSTNTALEQQIAVVEMASSCSNRCTRTSASLHTNSSAQTHTYTHIHAHMHTCLYSTFTLNLPSFCARCSSPHHALRFNSHAHTLEQIHTHIQAHAVMGSPLILKIYRAFRSILICAICILIEQTAHKLFHLAALMSASRTLKTNCTPRDGVRKKTRRK